MFDPTKPVQTRDGRHVRIYTMDAGGKYPIHGAIQLEADRWEHDAWMIDGSNVETGRLHNYDLINVPEKRRIKGWVNVYGGDEVGKPHRTKSHADMYDLGRIACTEIDIEYTVGEGLEHE